MIESTKRDITVIGAGLAGALLATLLAQRGWQVDVYEKRGDPRKHGYAGGRSINLALAERGRHALQLAGADGAVMAHAVMMRGRMVHFRDGRTELQRYGRDDSEVIWSVHRGDLNISLLDIAEAAGVRLHFDHALVDVDFDRHTARFRDESDGSQHSVDFSSLVGADGVGSALRAAMSRRVDLGERVEFLGHGYRELEIPPAADGSFRIEPHALHIWPRDSFMCIALPNDEKTFTVTLFLPNEGDPSFSSVTTGADARALFAREFADTLALIPQLEADFERNPAGALGTLYLDSWHTGSDAVLMGDAAHAMVPFHGQGMNCAFEDCVALANCLDAYPDRAEAFAAFQQQRLPNARAIQQMALENYLEMRDRVDDDDFLLQRDLERELAARHPGRFVPRYAMVSFMCVPYVVALERGAVQRAILDQLTQGKHALADVDLALADALVVARLQPITEQDAA